jgi:GT2 family glycosyltransferase
MSLAVVIVNWRSEALALRQAAQIRAWSELGPELFVVDNESTEASKAALAGALLQGGLISNEENLGYGGGNNCGIGRALAGNAQYVLLLNNDTEVSEKTIVHLIERLELNPDIHVIGPAIQELRDDGEHWYGGGNDIARNVSTRIGIAPRDRGSLSGDPPRPVDYVPGAVFIARREVFERVGLFDESFFFGGETADLCKRARDQGYGVFVDLAVSAQHDARQRSSHMRETLYAYYSLRNRMLYVRKHYPDEQTRLFAYWTAVCIAECGRALLRGRLDRARAVFLALAHGYANRSGNQNASFL